MHLVVLSVILLTLCVGSKAFKGRLTYPVISTCYYTDYIVSNECSDISYRCYLMLTHFFLVS